MSFLNTLNWWQWLLMAMVPICIISLYFLKLRRQPLVVPSTYLWSRTIEDLHVNSIWQRLRQSLLLLLQLLLLLLAFLAFVRPNWDGTELTGDRFVFLIDTSASMQATDLGKTRLELAKEQAINLIEQMKPGDAAMVISFSNTARIEQSFTSNRSLLRAKVDRIKATNRTSELSEALRAASGLANPGRASEQGSLVDIQVAEALPATLYIISDGAFASIPDFSLGNLEPKYIPVGKPMPKNVGIVSFTTEQNSEKPTQQQAFARIENHSDEDLTFNASLFMNGELYDAKQVTAAARQSAGVDFDFQAEDVALLRLQLEQSDDLEIDNTAFAVVNDTRLANVLLVTPGNDPLRQAMGTEEATKIASVTVVEPEYLKTEEFRQESVSGSYDLIVFDRCAPEVMPQANTLFIGHAPPNVRPAADPTAEAATPDDSVPDDTAPADVPPGEDAADDEEDTTQAPPPDIDSLRTIKPTAAPPIVIDTDRAHPLTQLIEFGNVVIIESFAMTPPSGGAVLIDADTGGIFAVAPRDGFEDAVLGFEIISTADNGAAEFNTDWPLRQSFPVFVLNALQYLGGTTSASATASANPGSPMLIRPNTPVDQIAVELPSGSRTIVEPNTQKSFVFVATEQLGLYHVTEGNAEKPTQHFPVNLFDTRESDLTPREAIELGHEEVKGQAGLEPTRKELWRWLLLAGLAVLVFEWYVYNRRVYL